MTKDEEPSREHGEPLEITDEVLERARAMPKRKPQTGERKMVMARRPKVFF